MTQQKENIRKTAILLVGSGAGSFGGVLLAELLRGKPAQAAPDSEKLQYIIDLLEELVKGDGLILDSMGNIVDALQNISDRLTGGEPGAIPSSILTPWVATEPDMIFEQAIRNAGVFFTTKRVDYRRGKRLALRCESSLDQPALLQTIGNFQDSIAGATDIGFAVPCLAGGSAGIGLAWDDWHPYIAVRMTIALPPTIGFLRIFSSMQE
jgi:hypothetical protein